MYHSTHSLQRNFKKQSFVFFVMWFFWVQLTLSLKRVRSELVAVWA